MHTTADKAGPGFYWKSGGPANTTMVPSSLFESPFPVSGVPGLASYSLLLPLKQVMSSQVKNYSPESCPRGLGGGVWVRAMSQQLDGCVG